MGTIIARTVIEKVQTILQDKTGVAEAKGDCESAMGTAIIRTTPQH